VERLLHELADAVGARAAALWLSEDGSLAVHAAWSAAPLDRRGFARQLADVHGRRGTDIVTESLARGRPVVESDLPAAALGHGAGASPWPLAAVPLAHGGHLLGVVALYGGEPLEAGGHLAEALAASAGPIATFLGRRSGVLRWPLTPRELEVLRLAADGLAGPQIASALQLSGATIKTHLANAYAKLGVSNRGAAVALALREGLIE
jgi:DNA-binding CsgD family transcriptional regulator